LAINSPTLMGAPSRIAYKVSKRGNGISEVQEVPSKVYTIKDAQALA